MDHNTWWDALAQEYALARGDDAARPSDLVHHALEGSLGDTVPNLVHRLEARDKDAAEILLVAGRTAYLVRVLGNATEVTFPGRLDGGVYTETIRVKAGRSVIDMRFTHDRLADELRASVTLLYDESRLARWDRAAAARSRELRATFRDWAAAPSGGS